MLTNTTHLHHPNPHQSYRHIVKENHSMVEWSGWMPAAFEWVDGSRIDGIDGEVKLIVFQKREFSVRNIPHDKFKSSR